MLSENEVWSELRKIVEPEGLGIFEVQCARGNNGVLRVFLCDAEGGTKGVGLKECTKVARKINDLPNVNDLIPGDSTLEVSSPGINRKLTRPEHFKGAVGERVKVAVSFGGRTAEAELIEDSDADDVDMEERAAREVERVKKGELVRGILREFKNDALTIEVEGSGEVKNFPLSTISRAQVDFLFE